MMHPDPAQRPSAAQLQHWRNSESLDSAMATFADDSVPTSLADSCSNQLQWQRFQQVSGHGGEEAAEQPKAKIESVTSIFKSANRSVSSGSGSKDGKKRVASSNAAKAKGAPQLALR